MEVKDFLDSSLSLLPVNVHDEVDAASHIVFDGVDALAAAAAHYQCGNAMDGFFGAAGVNGSERPTMTGVHRVQQCLCFRSAYFANNDAIRAMTENSPQQIIKCDLAAVGVQLRLRGDHMGLTDAQFRGVFDDKDALLLRDRIGQHVRHGRLAG